MNKKKKGSGKVVLLAFLDILAAAALVVLVYFTFFADMTLKNMGYSYGDIDLIKKYQIEDQITEYNQSLEYALNSQDFDAEKINYYLIFNSPIDYTKSINDLADKYSVEDLKSLQALLGDDQAIALVDCDTISNVDYFTQIVNAGYDVDVAVTLANSFADDDSIQSFLSLGTIENPGNYVKYLEVGYDNETIIALYKHSVTDFNYLAGIGYFEELSGLIQQSNFQAENLARYIWHMRNWGSDYARAVTRVNGNYDYTSPSNINYGWFYSSEDETAADTSSVTVLVNKDHYLDKNYVPENLVEVNASYRGNNQQLVQEAAEAFYQMSDDCYNDVNRRILAYSNYRSYTVEQALYDELSIVAEEGDSDVDCYASRAGYSEHQTGLAVDIAQKDYSYSELDECRSYDWLIENSWKYGYIQRYQEGKEWITGYVQCAYTFRYVGTEAAEIIHNYGFSLEEYAFLFDSAAIRTY